jgi:hypothetical protein
VDLENLAKLDLSKIKTRYGLCSCTEETINLQPLKMPELNKFMIPLETIADIAEASQSCNVPKTKTILKQKLDNRQREIPNYFEDLNVEIDMDPEFSFLT